MIQLSVFSPYFWIHRRAQTKGESVAIVTPYERITYSQLDKRINSLIYNLRNKLKIKKGDRLAVLGYNSPMYVETIAAASAMGSMVVPLSYRLEATEINFQIKDSGAKVVLTDDSFIELAKKACDDIARVKIIPRTDTSGGMSYEELADYKANIHDTDREGSEVPKVEGGETPLLIVYTSGTTGKPKGALITNSNMFWNAINDILGLSITYSDVTLTLLPMFHLGGINLFTFPTLLAGGTVAIPPKFDPTTALSLIEREKVTIVFGVPVMYQTLLEHIKLGNVNLSSVRVFYSGGAPLPADLEREFNSRGLPLVQGMGLTETSPTAFLSDIRDAGLKPGSIGKPSIFCSAKIVDEKGKELGVNERGEILISGPDVFKGYWKRKDETAKVLRQGWLHTGDVGYRDQHGYWFIVDRKKDMINSGGEKVYPSEVEEVLRLCNKVSMVAVIGVPDSKWGEVPKAIIVPKRGMKLSKEELESVCKGRLAKFKRPKYYAFVNEIPITPSGKVLKRELKAKYGLPKDEWLT